MLNETAKIGIEEILSQLDDTSLLSLAATVTQGLLKNKIERRDEANSAIINYSTDVISILRRKIITREILFTYAHKKSIPLNLPATKNDLINKIASFWHVECQTEVPPEELTSPSGNVTLLAQQFTQWFYSMMNRPDTIDPQHFYQDAKVKINMIINGQIMTEFRENDPLQVAQQLFHTKTTYNLYFNPNLTEQGVQGRIDPHGLVLVLACGTLHTNETCVGVFEQVFGLVRDPLAQNNWKIRSSELNLKSQSGVAGLPRLCDTELTSQLLSLPSS